MTQSPSPPPHLSPSLHRFLADNFETPDDLSRSPALQSTLQDRCSDLHSSLGVLSRRLSHATAAYASQSHDVTSRLSSVRNGLVDLGDELSGRSSEQILVVDLPALAKEVARVETVRVYAETALKLDSLIGDVEDAVSSSVAGKLRAPNAINSEELRTRAISSLKLIEDTLTSVSKSRPQWARLIAAVDHRVDRALAILRPQAIADHRSLLSSLGWPPPFSSFNDAHPQTEKSKEISNPLFLMKGDLKTKYCESFLSLCSLQELQKRRKFRQLEGHNLGIALCEPLWAIDELVNPITVACQRYFSKWLEKPEFIFALVYKITRDFVDSMDDVLQPLVDKAVLRGCSCREEWISAMVSVLRTCLSKEIFTQYIDVLPSSYDSSMARLSWLNLIDLMISFDKRIQSLNGNSGLLFSMSEDSLQHISTLSIFYDRQDWLEIWAQFELDEVLEKLRKATEEEKNWSTKIQETTLSGSEGYKSPAISSAVIQGLSLVTDRSRPLPSIKLKEKFIRLAGGPIVREFLDNLLRRCQEAEGLTALADDDALLKVSVSINAARYCESVLTEWSESMYFLEMESIAEDAEQGSIFSEEINSLKRFRIEWIEKISTVVLRGFDALIREYLKNKRQWLEKTEGMALSRAFVVALDYLQGKITKLDVLNSMDFVSMWRSVAGGVDLVLFNGLLMSSNKFNSAGLERLCTDLELLFGVFSAWCLRPRGFFPKLSDTLLLLKMDECEVKDQLAKGNERWLREQGLKQLAVADIEKIVKCVVD